MNDYDLRLDRNSSFINDLINQKKLYDILSSALEIGLFDKISTTSSKIQLSKKYGFEPETLELLLKVLVHAGYIEEKDDIVLNSEVTQTFLLKKSFRNMISEFSNNSAAKIIVNCIRAKVSPRKEPEWSEKRLLRLGNSALNGAILNLINSVDLTDRRNLLDLGGGHGFYSIAFAKKYPNLNITLQDLPQVMPFVQKIINKFKLQKQIKLMPIDFVKEDIVGNYDTILCSNILHYDKIDIVLPKVYKALCPNGLFVLKNRVSDHEDNLENSIRRLFWHIKGGRVIYSTGDWTDILKKYDFLEISTRFFYEINAVITAKKTG